MPLTFSHPAVVLPMAYLPKRWVSLTGLITGSVAPDFEYFLRMRVESIYSHTWLGLLWFDLPVGLLMAFVYHDVVKHQFVANLPVALNNRLAFYDQFTWNQYFVKYAPVVILSILIGGASHLFWDSFTHASGYFVRRWDMMLPVTLFGLKLPLYKVIQHLSTLIGGLIIIVAVYKLSRLSQKVIETIWPYWTIVSGVIIIVIGLRLLSGLSIHQYWNVLVTAISGGISGIIIASLSTGFKKKRPIKI